MRNEPPDTIIGVIDHTGAILHRPLYGMDAYSFSHSTEWPTITHKRWRFLYNNWKLENSCLSSMVLTEAEFSDVEVFVRKHYTPPLWVIRNEEWEALGRPHSGKKYEEYEEKWRRIFARKNKH